MDVGVTHDAARVLQQIRLAHAPIGRVGRVVAFLASGHGLMKSEERVARLVVIEGAWVPTHELECLSLVIRVADGTLGLFPMEAPTGANALSELLVASETFVPGDTFAGNVT